MSRPLAVIYLPVPPVKTKHLNTRLASLFIIYGKASRRPGSDRRLMESGWTMAAERCQFNSIQ